MSRITCFRSPFLTDTPGARLLRRATLILVALTQTSAIAESDHIYLEENGYVHFEAEDAGDTGAWRLQSGLDGYSGTGYLEWTGSNHFSEEEAGDGTIRYQFRIETAGNYELRWRSRIAKGDSNTESNDTWVRFATGSNVAGEQALNGWTKVYMGEFGVWSWSARTVDQQAKPVRQYFSPGEHTVEISGRSNGHAIDRIALYNYDAVSFDAGLNGTLPLSRYLIEGEAMVDPNPLIVPVPETAPSDLVNATPIAVDNSQNSTAVCTAGTLTLPATRSATWDTLAQADPYNTDALALQADRSSVLLSFDLSPLPVVSAAELHYSAVDDNSNGQVNVYLGSHNDWPDDDTDNTPAAQVRIAEAQGGWIAGVRYTSQLDATLLPRDETTLLLALSTGSDQLLLGDATDLTSVPRLVLSGDGDFCADWEANVAEAQSQSSTTQDNSKVDTPTNTAKKSGLGGSSHWLLLIVLTELYRRRPRRPATECMRPCVSCNNAGPFCHSLETTDQVAP